MFHLSEKCAKRHLVHMFRNDQSHDSGRQVVKQVKRDINKVPTFIINSTQHTCNN